MTWDYEPTVDLFRDPPRPTCPCGWTVTYQTGADEWECHSCGRRFTRAGVVTAGSNAEALFVGVLVGGICLASAALVVVTFLRAPAAGKLLLALAAVGGLTAASHWSRKASR